MPHELSFAENGEAEMFYVGPEPWHRRGQKLDGPATAREAIEAAHLDWTVELQPIYRGGSEGSVVVPDRYAIVRTDNDKMFDIVSSDYEIVQNVENFDLFEGVIGQGQAVYHTAGALRDGRVVFILAKLPDTIEVVKNDPIEKFILLSTSHDRTKSLEMAITPIRVVCMNTLRVAMRDARHRIKIKHTSGLFDRAVEAREALQLTDAYYQIMMEGVDRLARTPMRTRDMEEYASAYLNVNPEKPEMNRNTAAAHEQLCDLFETGRGQDIPGVRGTAYAAFNATTEFVDNYGLVKVDSDIRQDSEIAQDLRMYRSWFGRGQERRNTGWTMLQNYSVSGLSAFQNTFQPRDRGPQRTVIAA
jgi:phage/plasmid-like protein (TIGR03299 family)